MQRQDRDRLQERFARVCHDLKPLSLTGRIPAEIHPIMP
jgi:hypothetical protein